MTDQVWLSAYQKPYDWRPAVKAWSSGAGDVAAKELWGNLYHQGSIGSASLAAAPDLVRLLSDLERPDWSAYALLASIEQGRADGALPPELESAYQAAWADLVSLAFRDLREASDDLLVRSILAVIAHAKGQRSLAALALCTEDERREMLAG
ncbi:hypothetical protein [Sphingomonas oryzagri]|uniref:Uncharacterized protein n=1 Tax=Sphingomonas oryzagri TaxID=3042314 RepID=A0ABT6MY56_9SPHN|nr:hypothetical protein [Sphingomonas oryzagri]MDH7637994.1 hypothetical protein [Sphingomonas oryzagri]